MKKPDISQTSSDPALAGTQSKKSWVKGRNCVYIDRSIANYRVSVRTRDGWKSYGHFRDLETASYVANIAILVEECEGAYELNSGIGEKDRKELETWRNQGANRELESRARERYELVKADLKAAKREARAAREMHERQVLEQHTARNRSKVEWKRAHDAKMHSLRNMSSEELERFISSAKHSDPYYVIAKGELRGRKQ